MTTPNDIVNMALLDAGIVGQGQTPEAEDVNNAFTRLQWMIAEWNRKRWLIYHLQDTGVTSTGAQSYTVGPAQAFNIPRPDRLEAAYLLQLNSGLPVTYPLEILQSYEDYARIRLKTLTSFPGAVFYDSGWPTGLLYPWPIPLASIYAVHIVTKVPLTALGSLTQDITMPPEYPNAIHTNLVVRLRAAYQLPPDPVMVGLAKDALNVIRGANAQIPRLGMPNAVTRRGPGYNIIGDQP